MSTIRLAPLAGVTDWIFRELCFAEGCDVAYTEMVSAMGVLCAPKGQPATEQLLKRGENEKCLILQIFGKEPKVMARAAEMLTALDRFDGVDINMGCPAHKVAGSGEGSGLMRTPQLAEDIMRAVVRATHLPVSVKFRLGWDHASINVVEMAQRAENAGVSAVMVHGRTRMQQYSGLADWDIIRQVKRAVSIPVYGNGDIDSPDTALHRLSETGVDGVVIGRGAMGKPWLFHQIQQAMISPGEKPVVPLQHQWEVLLSHYDRMLAWKETHIAVREMRKHIAWYIHGMRGASQMRVRINGMDHPDQVKEALFNFYSSQMPMEQGDPLLRHQTIG